VGALELIAIMQFFGLCMNKDQSVLKQACATTLFVALSAALPADDAEANTHLSGSALLSCSSTDRPAVMLLISKNADVQIAFHLNKDLSNSIGTWRIDSSGSSNLTAAFCRPGGSNSDSSSCVRLHSGTLTISGIDGQRITGSFELRQNVFSSTEKEHFVATLNQEPRPKCG
jgi:hypothetical protein